MSENPKLGSYAYYARLYEVEDSHWWAKGMRDIATRILHAQYPGAKSLSILDAGCGSGITLTWLKPYSLRRPVVGIDISWDALQFCQKRGHVSLCQASAVALPCQREVFDLVVCHDVIQHLAGYGADTQALQEFYRVLKPGGCLFVRTNASQGLGQAKSLASQDYRRYSRDELREHLQQIGFHILKATHANTLMSILPTLTRYLRRRDPQQHHDQGLAIRLLPSSLQWLNRLLYGVMQGEAWLLSQPSRTSPFGQTIMVLAQKPQLDLAPLPGDLRGPDA